MFDKEKAIGNWRKQMLKGGVESAVLMELENHLREEMEQQIRRGSSSQQAFETAVERMGQAGELKREFRKVGELPETRFVKLMGIGCVTFALLFSLWIGSFLFHHEIGWGAKISGVAAIATTALSWKYSGKFLPVVRNHWMRAAIGFLCCIGCVLWIQFFIVNVVPYVLAHPGTITPPGQKLATFLWGWTVMAVLAGIGVGLERAARKSVAT